MVLQGSYSPIPKARDKMAIILDRSLNSQFIQLSKLSNLEYMSTTSFRHCIMKMSRLWQNPEGVLVALEVRGKRTGPTLPHTALKTCETV